MNCCINIILIYGGNMFDDFSINDCKILSGLSKKNFLALTDLDDESFEIVKAISSGEFNKVVDKLGNPIDDLGDELEPIINYSDLVHHKYKYLGKALSRKSKQKSLDGWNDYDDKKSSTYPEFDEEYLVAYTSPVGDQEVYVATFKADNLVHPNKVWFEIDSGEILDVYKWKKLPKPPKKKE